MGKFATVSLLVLKKDLSEKPPVECIKYRDNFLKRVPHYKILGFEEPNYSRRVLRKAYLKASLVAHLDKLDVSLKEHAEALFAWLKITYEQCLEEMGRTPIVKRAF